MAQDKWDQYAVQPNQPKDKWDQYAAPQSQPVPAPRDAEGPRPTEPLPGDEAEAAGMQTLVKEHPGLVAGAAAAGAAPALAVEGVPTAIGEGIKEGAMRIPPAYYGYKKGQSIGQDIGGEPGKILGGVAGGALGFFAPELLKRAVGRYLPPVPIRVESGGPTAPQDGPVVTAPEPREPAAGERPGSQFSVPREQLPSNIRSGQPGAGEAYRSIGGKIIYTPPRESDVDLEQIRQNAGLSRSGKVRSVSKPTGSR